MTQRLAPRAGIGPQTDAGAWQNLDDCYMTMSAPPLRRDPLTRFVIKRPWAIDLLVVLAWGVCPLAASFGSVGLPMTSPQASAVGGAVALVVVSIAALSLRRFHLAAVPVAMISSLLAFGLLNYPTVLMLTPALFSVYALVARGRRWPWWGVACTPPLAAAVVWFGGNLVPLLSRDGRPVTALFTVLTLSSFVAALVGIAVRQRRTYVRGLERLAHISEEPSVLTEASAVADPVASWWWTKRFGAQPQFLIESFVGSVGPFYAGATAIGRLRTPGITFDQVFESAVLLAVAALIVAGFLLRARSTVVFVVICVLGVAAIPLAPLWISTLSPAVFAVYSAVRARIGPGWIAAGTLFAIGTTVTVVASNLSGIEGATGAVFLFAVVVLIAALCGTIVRTRLDYAAARDHEREQLTRVATLNERNRIAREMHDIVSHSISAMITLADGAAASVQPADQPAAGGIRRIAEAGRSALGDMRRMLGVLDEDESSAPGVVLKPQPSLADLEDLIASFNHLGIPARLDIAVVQDGSPTAHLHPVERRVIESKALREVNAAIGLAAYRIVQESLTNALRYAAQATTVKVHVTMDSNSLTVTVLDDGNVVASTASHGARRGILGIRQRVAALGGEFTAGPRDGEPGWLVSARIPVPRASK